MTRIYVRLSIFLASLLVLGASTSAAAQPSLSTVAPGTRIRVTMPQRIDGRLVHGSGRWVTGTLTAVDSAQLTMRRTDQADGEDLTARYGSIEEIQVSAGAMRGGEGGARGAIRGALVGAGIFGALLVLRNNGDAETCDADVDPDCSFVRDKRFPVRGGAIGVGGGALVGFLFGSRSNERWRPLRSPRGDFLLRRMAMAFTIEARPIPRRAFNQPVQ